MKNKFNTILIILLVINMCASAGLAYFLVKNANECKRLESKIAENSIDKQSGNTADAAQGNNMTEDSGLEKTEQYVMYVGTNDKDSYSQLISTEDAKKMIDEICFRYVEGYTIMDAIGSWTDEKKNVTKENTIVCYFDNTDKTVVHKIADEIIKALNQNTVLIEKDELEMEYYAGN